MTAKAQKTNAPGFAVGSFAAVKSGGRVQLLDRLLQFDVTGSVLQIGSKELSVSLIPYPLGSEARYLYAPLRYKNIQIVPATE
jgi:hypothetical protein